MLVGGQKEVNMMTETQNTFLSGAKTLSYTPEQIEKIREESKKSAEFSLILKYDLLKFKRLMGASTVSLIAWLLLSSPGLVTPEYVYLGEILSLFGLCIFL